MRILIIGYGSIGKRHARLLADMGHSVSCMTSNNECPFPVASNMEEALSSSSPEAVIISNRTMDHLGTLQVLRSSGYSGPVLVEKPLFTKVVSDDTLGGDNVYVAYNLRYHAIVQRCREILDGKTIYSAQFHVGQYLPDWRPGTDYTACYSARKAEGGGVIRDLSHELDMAQYLLGTWKRVTALGGHFSPLKIDSDDVYSLLLETERCPVVSVHMDYLNRIMRRGFDMNLDGVSLRADFVSGTLEVNEEVETFSVERDQSFIAQLEAFTSGALSQQCSFDQGLAVIALIEAAEQCATNKIWVER